MLVPLGFGDAPCGVDLFLDGAEGVALVVGIASASVADQGLVSMFVVGDAAVVDGLGGASAGREVHAGRVAVAGVSPGARAPAVGVVPVPLEMEGEAAFVDLADEDAAAVGVGHGVVERVGGPGEAALGAVPVMGEEVLVSAALGAAQQDELLELALAGVAASDDAVGGVDDAGQVAALPFEADDVAGAVAHFDEAVARGELGPRGLGRSEH